MSQSRIGRDLRVNDLRQLLADGSYDVPPDVIATKMIGRALCDQVFRSCDPRDPPALPVNRPPTSP